MVHIESNQLTEYEFCYLIEQIGGNRPNILQVRTAIENSIVTFSVYNEDFLIGMGRVIGDYGYSFFIKDILIVPKYQKMGIGTLLLNEILRYIEGITPKGWNVTVELMSALNRESFYERLGFMRRPMATKGAGMGILLIGNGRLTEEEK